ncbi:MAG TPA: sigma factor-like helix-turn-helix DNA-binding protein [Solirubrobacteraceae bacterium]|nr:sigma factor-like helix-turn-helix DNA-binding protein [Solirubrobacteraceae bacterium]
MNTPPLDLRIRTMPALKLYGGRPSAMAPPTIVDPAACDGCKLAPGSPERGLQMVSLRAQGWNLEEIALRYEVSRERVRQILRAHGDGPAPEDIAEARRRRARRLAEAAVEDLLALWRAGESPSAAATKLGLQSAACRMAIERFATDVDRAARRESLAVARATPMYSDGDITWAVLSAAARIGRVPSAKEYAALAQRLGLPSLGTVLNRMGGWSNAIAAAGLRPVPIPTRRPRRRRWTEDACWDALRRAVDELGEIPSVVAYERLAAGRDDMPSSATIRNRLGRWSTLQAQLTAQRQAPARRRQRSGASRRAAS